MICNARRCRLGGLFKSSDSGRTDLNSDSLRVTSSRRLLDAVLLQKISNLNTSIPHIPNGSVLFSSNII